MKFNIINRRTHLYLGLALIPWVLVYGLSSLVINHGPFFNKIFHNETPMWSTKFEQEYHRPVPENADLREVATEILNEFELRNSFFVSRPTPDRLNIIVKDFISVTRLTYFIEDGRLLVEEQNFQFRTFLIVMHLRGGYEQDNFLDDLWAVILDLVCIAFAIWVFSGIYIWWKLRDLRLWGWVALVGGPLTFGWFLLAL
jgi:hypothetical protein